MLLLLKKNLSEQYSEEDIKKKLNEAIKRHINLDLLRRIERGLKIQTQQEQKITIERFFNFLCDLEEKGLLDKRDQFQSLEIIFQWAPQKLLADFFELMNERFIKDPQQLALNYVNLLNNIAKCSKEVMRNVSVTNDTHFRGEVLTKVASIFPLEHKSGHNKAGLYNTKNETTYEKQIQDELPSEDYWAYKNCWELQKYLAQPLKIFTTNQLDFGHPLPQQAQTSSVEQQNNGSNVNGSNTFGSFNLTPNLDYHGRANELQEESKGNSMNEEDQREEGQADDDLLQEEEAYSEMTKLEQVLYHIKLILNGFADHPLQVDKSQTRIMNKDPKYLTKFSLLKLQSQDYVFRETFMAQVLILTRQLQHPITKEQQRLFKLSPEELKKIQSLEERIYSMLKAEGQSGKILGKRKSMSQCLKSVMDKETNWAKWKEASCFNISKPSSTKISERLRDIKASQKLMPSELRLQCSTIDMHDRRSGQAMRKLFAQPQETLNEQGNSLNIKAEEIPSLGDFVEPLITDIDPDNDIEEEYKNKRKKVFSWRFLRLLSFCYLYNFHGDPDEGKGFQKFDGNAEKQANILYKKNKKKDIYLQVNQPDSEMVVETQEKEMIQAINDQASYSNGNHKIRNEQNGEHQKDQVKEKQPGDQQINGEVQVTQNGNHNT